MDEEIIVLDTTSLLSVSRVLTFVAQRPKKIIVPRDCIYQSRPDYGAIEIFVELLRASTGENSSFGKVHEDILEGRDPIFNALVKENSNVEELLNHLSRIGIVDMPDFDEENEIFFNNNAAENMRFESFHTEILRSYSGVVDDNKKNMRLVPADLKALSLASFKKGNIASCNDFVSSGSAMSIIFSAIHNKNANTISVPVRYDDKIIEDFVNDCYEKKVQPNLERDAEFIVRTGIIVAIAIISQLPILSNIYSGLKSMGDIYHHVKESWDETHMFKLINTYNKKYPDDLSKIIESYADFMLKYEKPEREL